MNQFFIGSTDLVALCQRPKPFGSLFVSAGAHANARARQALDRLPMPAPHAGALLDAVDNVADSSDGSLTTSVIAYADAEGNVEFFTIDDPFTIDLACFGSHPTLGPLLEARQLLASHAVVTVDDDAYGLTTFGSLASPLASPASVSVNEAVNHTIEQLRFFEPQLLAIVGPREVADDTVTQMRAAFPEVTINTYASDDLDRDLMHVAEDVVRDAASLASENVTRQLGVFRAERTAGQVAEGLDAVDAVSSGRARRVLVHDNVADALRQGGDRPVDELCARAIVQGVPITMIPDVPPEQGPIDGMGAILLGDAADLRSQHNDRLLTTSAEKHQPGAESSQLSPSGVAL